VNGSSSPVLTATHHFYGSPRLSDFFPAHAWRSDPSIDLHAKWLKRRGSSQVRAPFSRIATFNIPTSRAPKAGLPTGIFKCQITQFWHFSKAFGSENLALAVWHIFGIIFTTLAVKFLEWQ